jgi:hypothetical protein
LRLRDLLKDVLDHVFLVAAALKGAIELLFDFSDCLSHFFLFSFLHDVVVVGLHITLACLKLLHSLLDLLDVRLQLVLQVSDFFAEAACASPVMSQANVELINAAIVWLFYV